MTSYEEIFKKHKKWAAVQKTYLKSGCPVVHGWIFDIRTGELIDLNIDFREKLEKIREIYDLGTND